MVRFPTPDERPVRAPTPPLPPPLAPQHPDISDGADPWWARVDRPLDLEECRRLGQELSTLSGEIAAAEYRRLWMIRVFDASNGWSGFLSCAQWLSWHTSMGTTAARDRVRVARALGALPVTSAVMARGELSYSKVRALTRVATPATEAELVEIARDASAGQLERIVRCWRGIDRAEEAREEQRQEARAHLHLRLNEHGTWDVRGELPPEVGARLAGALDAARERLYRRERAEADSPAQGGPSFGQRQVHALEFLAELAMSNPSLGAEGGVVRSAERNQLVVHVDATALMEAGVGADASAEAPKCLDGTPRASAEASGRAAGAGACAGDGQLTLACGTAIGANTARALACDGSTVLMLHDAAGRTLDVGRRTRLIPPAIRRALDHRDGGCVFPGCGNRFCQAHHVRHWADGGETALHNLVLLCPRHHTMVHKEGYRLEISGEGELEVYSPHGWRLGARPAPAGLRPEVAVAALLTRNREAGVAVDAETAAARGRTARMDLHWVMHVLRSRMAPNGGQRWRGGPG